MMTKLLAGPSQVITKWGQQVLLISFGGLPLLFVIALLIIIGWQAFQVSAFQVSGTDASGFTLAHFFEVYSDPFIYETIVNTVVFSVVSVLTAGVLAVPLAWFTERTSLPGRSLILPVMILSLLIPGFATAMGWIALLHVRIGIISQWLAGMLSVDQSPININNVVGMGFVQGLSLTGLLFIMIASSFRAMDPALEESAEVHGLSLAKRLRKVTLPLMWPSILAAGLYTFTIGFGSFDIPAIIGMGSDISLFSTLIYHQIRPEGGVPEYELAAATSFIMFILAILMSYWYLRVVKRAGRHSVITGKGYRPKLIELGSLQILLAWAFVGIVVLLKFGLPLTALFWTSLNSYFVPPSLEAFSNISLDAYRHLSFSHAGNAIKNTLILVVAVPTATVLFSLAISWVVIRARVKGISESYDALAFLPHAIPNVILALGAFILGLYYVPIGIPFYGTIYILLAIYTVTHLGFATRVYNSALLQIDRELDEAGAVFGLKRIMVLRKILLPLMLPAILYTWVWMALLAYRELTMAAFLASRSNNVLSTFIWQRWQQETSEGAALSIIMILVMMPGVGLYVWITRRTSLQLHRV